MAIVFIFSVVLQALLYEISSGEPCVGEWSTETTKYRTLNFKDNSFVHVSCKYRDLKVDGEVIRCVDGQLPTYLPQCVLTKASCAPLKAHMFGWMRCSTTAPEVGSVCAFACQNTHHLKGTSTRICTEDLRWSGSAVRCIRKAECYAPPPPHQGFVIGCSPQRKPKYDDTCYFRCKEGFRLVGPSELKCRLNGKLTDEKGRQIFPRCEPFVPTNHPANTYIQNRPRPISPTSWLSCEVSNGYCSHYCHQEPKGVRCSCRRGYRLADDGKTCFGLSSTVTVTPGDEDFRYTPHLVSPPPSLSCQVHQGYCSHYCHQEAEGVRCSCRSGYGLSSDGRTCLDVNECQDETLNQCDHLCRNAVGSYQCLCRRGYTSPDGFRCERMPTFLTVSPGDEDFQNTPRPVSATSWFSCQKHNGNCSQHCHQETEGVRCSCRSGYQLASDGRTCVDEDECRDKRQNKCDHVCQNTPGGYKCSCREGYTSPVGFRCKDVDECSDDKLNKCDHTCKNTVGGYICYCREGFVSPDGFRCEGCRVNSYRNTTDVTCKECPADSHTDGEEKTSINDCICNPGFTGDVGQGIPCTDIDECADGENFGCSHTCINTPGKAHCACPLGYQLQEDGKTCIAVHCPRLFVPQHSKLKCKNSTTSKDVVIYRSGELLEDKEFPAGFTCKVKCDKGYDFLNSHSEIVCQNDGKWNASLPECRVLQCPPLSPPLNGDVYPSSCKNGSSTVKQKCVFTCQPGYRITGLEMLTCRNNLTWAKKKPTQCVPETEVWISCPDDDITIELTSDEGSAEMQLNSPRTTFAARPIHVSPEWVSLDRASVFPAGETEVTFSVTVGNKTAECSTSVIVLDKHPPVFPDCPDTLFVTYNLGETAVNWEEPVPQDNVGIASVSKSLEPNSTLSPGLHFVEYVARDFAGNIGKCIFHINVTAEFSEE